MSGRRTGSAVGSRTQRVFRLFDRALDYAVAGTFLATVVVLCLQIFHRYVLSVPLVWSTPLSLFLFVWAIWLAGADPGPAHRGGAGTARAIARGPRAAALGGRSCDVAWRSLLFMPVLEERFFAGAQQRGADAIVLDLEASVAASRKQEACAAQDVLVRVNMPWWPAFADLEFAVRNDVGTIVVPGADTCEHMCAVDACISELEAERGLSHGGIGLIPVIETARGVRDADTVLRLSDRIVAVDLGVGDCLADMAPPASIELQRITSLAIFEAARARRGRRGPGGASSRF